MDTKKLKKQGAKETKGGNNGYPKVLKAPRSLYPLFLAHTASPPKTRGSQRQGKYQHHQCQQPTPSPAIVRYKVHVPTTTSSRSVQSGWDPTTPGCSHMPPRTSPTHSSILPPILAGTLGATADKIETETRKENNTIEKNNSPRNPIPSRTQCARW